MADIRIIVPLGVQVPPAPSSEAFDYRKWGIPYPTDPVPSAIMPTLPTGADFTNHEWINTYDPCTIPNPDHADIAPNWPSAEQPDCYYIDQFNGGTDTDNDYGYPNKPRASIPSAAFGASSLYLEIHGNNANWSDGNPQYSIDPTITMSGTSVTPKFIVGVDGPWLARDWDVSGQHLIFDGLKLQERAAGNQFARFTVIDGGEYICFRNGELRGSGTSDGGQCFGMDGSSTQPVNFVVLYNSEIHQIGAPPPTATSQDAHCWRPTYWCRYLWCIDNIIHDAEGDGVQVGNSANTNPVAASAHYVYIGGNDFYSFRENCIDLKNSYHVVSAKNELHDTDFNDGSNDTGVIVSNNSEGTNTRYHWYIANEAYSCAPAFRFSGNQTGERDYLICNWIHDCDSGISFGEFGGLDDVDEYVVHNTITNCSGGMLTEGFGAPAEIEVSGNISYDCGATHIEAPTNNGATVSTLEYQLTYNSDTSNAEDNAASFDTATGNQENTNPVFTNPGSDDFTLQAGSPAIGAVTTRSSVFTEFQNLYGIDIAYDYAGNAIPATNADAGAWQRV